MFEIVRFDKEEKYIKDFIALKKKLYTRKNNTESVSDITRILTETHPLSHYFKLDKFLIYDDGKVCGRFCFTRYEDDPVCYIGFYECVNDEKAAKFLFDNAARIASEMGYKRITGPVDCSFWIKYRLKINLFDRLPYTGEPYNLDYYLKQFTDNGYEVCEHYISNYFTKIVEPDAKYVKRLNEFRAKGYEIRSPLPEEFDKVIGEIYVLITRLYSNFPIYRGLTEEEFRKIFNDYRLILDMRYVKMAYYQGEAVAFFIGVPDYGARVYNTKNLINLLGVLKRKKKAEAYVLPYLGALPEHAGLGAALTGAMMIQLQQTGGESIGALCRDGKISGHYAKVFFDNEYEYALLTKDISGEQLT